MSLKLEKLELAKISYLKFCYYCTCVLSKFTTLFNILILCTILTQDLWTGIKL